MHFRRTGAPGIIFVVDREEIGLLFLSVSEVSLMSNDLLRMFKPEWATDLEVFSEMEPAVERIEQIYDHEVDNLRKAFQAFVAGDRDSHENAAYYPFLGVYVQPQELNLDGRLAFGALHEPNVYGTTLTRPALFKDYFRDQIGRLMANHGVPVVVGRSRRPLPLPFVVDEVSGDLPPDRAREVQYRFSLPDLRTTDDSIANGTWSYNGEEPYPLALFTAERVDYSLHRLHHYTGTTAEHFQPYILLTNYQRYVDHFVKLAKDEVASGRPGVSFVEPGDIVTSADEDGDTPSLAHLPQMPAYHFKRPDGAGVTMVNIGIGPSNAKTITDHLAVLRPHCWLMLGHCAGLRRSQRLGDYVLAHGYVREDHVLDKEVPNF
ncbi:MAG: AMP nucleosidase, partial [Pseudomonadota bacterium]